MSMTASDIKQFNEDELLKKRKKEFDRYVESFKQKLDEDANKLYCYASLDLSYYNFNELDISNLLNILDNSLSTLNKKNVQGDFTLELSLDFLNEKGINAVNSLLNKLNTHWNNSFILRIRSNTGNEPNVDIWKKIHFGILKGLKEVKLERVKLGKFNAIEIVECLLDNQSFSNLIIKDTDIVQLGDQGVKAFLDKILEHTKIKTCYLYEDNIFSLDCKILLGSISSFIQKSKNLILWTNFDLKNITKQWEREKCCDLAKIFILRLATTGVKFSYDSPPLAFTRFTVQEMINIYTEFQISFPEFATQLKYIDLGNDFSKSEIEAIKSSIDESAIDLFRIKEMLRQQMKQDGFLNSCYVGAALTGVQFQSLLNFLQTELFPHNSKYSTPDHDLEIVVNLTSIQEADLPLFIHFIEELKGSSSQISLEICHLKVTNVNFVSILEAIKDSKMVTKLSFHELVGSEEIDLVGLISAIIKNQPSCMINLENNNLWNTDKKNLNEIANIVEASTVKNTKLTLRLWNSHERELIKAAKSWDDEEKSHFALLQLRIFLACGIPINDAWRFPFEIDLYQGEEIITKILDQAPTIARYVVEIIQCIFTKQKQTILLQNLVRDQNFFTEEAFKKYIENDFGEEGYDSDEDDYKKILLHDFQFRSEIQTSIVKKLISILPFPFFRLSETICLKLDKIFIENLSTLSDFLSLFQDEPDGKKPKNLIISDQDFVNNKGEKVVHFFKNAQLRIFNIKRIHFNLNIGDLNDPSFIENLVKALKSLELKGNIEVSFNQCNLSRLGSKHVLILFNAITSCENFSHIDFSNNNLATLGEDFIQQLAEDCTSKKLASMDLQGNGDFETFSLSTLMKAIKSFKKANLEELKWLKSFKKSNFSKYCEEGENALVAELFFDVLSLDSEVSCYSISWFNLEKEKYYQHFLNYSQNTNSPSADTVQKLIQDLELEYKHRYDLCKKLMAKNNSFAFFPIKNFDLTPSDRLNLLLEHYFFDFDDSAALYNQSEFKHLLKKFSLYDSHLPASPFIDFFQGDNPINHEEWDEYRSVKSVEVAKDIQQKLQILGGNLKKICSKTGEIKKQAFYELTLNKLLDWKLNDEYAAIHFTNMVYWFVWTCLFINSKSNISLDNFGMVFNEIRDFPNPRLRFQITKVLIMKVCQDEVVHSIFHQLCSQVLNQKLAPHLIIPAIYLCAIVKENNENTLKEEQELKETEELQTILKSLPADYKHGHYLRTLVSAFQLLAVYPNIPSYEKLALIKKVIGLQSHALSNQTQSEKMLFFIEQFLQEIPSNEEAKAKFKAELLEHRKSELSKRIHKHIRFKVLSPDLTIEDKSIKKLTVEEKAINTKRQEEVLKVLEPLIHNTLNSRLFIPFLPQANPQDIFKARELSEALDLNSVFKDFNDDEKITIYIEQSLPVLPSNDEAKAEFETELLEYKKSELSKAIYKVLSSKVLSPDLTIEDKSIKKLTVEEKAINTRRQEEVLKVLGSLIHYSLDPGLLFPLPPQVNTQSLLRARQLSEALGLNTIFNDFKDRDPKETEKAVLHEKNKRLIKTLQNKILNHNKELEFNNQLSFWFLFQGLCDLKELDRITLSEQLDFRSLTKELFQEYFKVDAEQFNFISETFSGKRNEAGLFTYLGKIRLLPDAQRLKMEAAFQRFIQTILSEKGQKFYSMRYDETLNPHLQVIFADNALIKANWMAGAQYPLSSFIEEYQIKAKPFYQDYYKLFKNSILNGHLPASHYSEIISYMECKEEKEKLSILKRLQELVSQMPKHAYMYNVPKDILRALVQIKMIDLLKINTRDPKAKVQIMQLLGDILSNLQRLNEGIEFQHDIAANKESVRASSDKPLDIDPRWVITDTDHYWTAFNIGSDMPDSCQRIDGMPELNQCLMGFVLNGQDRFIVILDETGKTHCRFVFRIMFDSVFNERVLYQEQIYPGGLCQQLRDALVQLAKLRAESLGLPLVTTDPVEGSIPYPNKLESYGGLAPCEFVDSLHSIGIDSKFTIEESHILYLPPHYLLKHYLAPILQNDIKHSHIQIINEYAMYQPPSSLHFAYNPKKEKGEENSVKERKLIRTAK